MPNKQTAAPASVHFRIRIYRNQDIAVGPGRVALLEAIDTAGSISGAARQLGMSYRRAWNLIDSTNRALQTPAVVSTEGGARGGGSQLTPVGHQLITLYREAETLAAKAAHTPLEQLNKLLAQ